ncbi:MULTISPECIES: GPP34 family phosphoprotein [Streptomyces]|uniref:GOLPH3/VPS74 family protein n=1 Tax=Streptomyces TaxID=1883 RepID=UPI001BDDA045|nr:MULTISPECIES: GPP34 family phosphoprotein [Streptomyces]MBT1104687.1 GPP34 family phosphoprotein [Streptomyces sp. Tu10]WUC90379.1 GPP34 family phosphoprotein [Streptomyces anulatus]WUD92537.1 GPP34 family phosphoprotein [Streptomyces anulatus]
MTTAKDLFIIAMDPVPDHAVGQGDLSLALAGAELLDLIGAGVVTVDGDLIVPGGSSAPDDRLLGEAAARISGQPPYERIEDWLWRRGRDLAAAYQDALEEDGELTQKRSGRLPFGPRRVELVDTPGRRRAVARREEGEPVLAALASAVGIDGGPSGDDEPRLDDGTVTTVVATVHEAVMELEAVRQRRTIENTAFANVWRGP